MSALGAFAELDSAMKSENVKAGIATLRQKGAPIGRVPAGFKRRRVRSLENGRVQIPCKGTEDVARKIAECREKGMGFDSISDEIEDYVAARDGRKSYRGIRSRYEWSIDKCRSLHRRLEEGVFDSKPQKKSSD
jgi:hypothetical protein